MYNHDYAKQYAFRTKNARYRCWMGKYCKTLKPKLYKTIAWLVTSHKFKAVVLCYWLQTLVFLAMEPTSLVSGLTILLSANSGINIFNVTTLLIAILESMTIEKNRTFTTAKLFTQFFSLIFLFHCFLTNIEGLIPYCSIINKTFYLIFTLIFKFFFKIQKTR